EGVWPPIGLRQLVDSGEHRDSVAPVTNRAAPLRPVMPALWSNDYGGVTLGVRARPMRTPDTERGLFVASAATRGDATSAVSLGLVYQHATPLGAYTYKGLGRITGEVSVRTPLSRGTTFGVRVFTGASLGSSNPVRQLRVAVAGADPYETFTNPLLRSRGA